MSKYRLPLALLLLIPLIGVVYFLSRERERDEAKGVDPTTLLPTLKAEDIQRISIHSPRTGDIGFAREGESFRITEPLSARPDPEAMQALIDALVALRALDVAATRKDNHARLWVDEGRAVRIKLADAAGEPLLDLMAGRYLPSSEETRVRLYDQEIVVKVKGWLGEKIERKLEDWRARIFFGVEPAEVQKVSFACPNAQLSFVREGEGWKPAEGQKPIAALEPKQLENRVTSLARFRASGFAEPNVDATQAGTGPEAVRRVSFETNEDPPRSFHLRLGEAAGTQKRDDGTDKQMFYVEHDDDPVVYTTSEYLRNYLCPAPADLAQPLPSGTP